MIIQKLNDLITVEELVKKHPRLTIGGVRWWLFNRNKNGLADSGAIIKMARKLFIDEIKFIDWLYKNEIDRK
jgi:hypothetical protein